MSFLEMKRFCKWQSVSVMGVDLISLSGSC